MTIQQSPVYECHDTWFIEYSGRVDQLADDGAVLTADCSTFGKKVAANLIVLLARDSI